MKVSIKITNCYVIINFTQNKNDFESPWHRPAKKKTLFVRYGRVVTIFSFVVTNRYVLLKNTIRSLYEINILTCGGQGPQAYEFDFVFSPADSRDTLVRR